MNAVTDEIAARPCTCHPDDNPPVPCAKKYALSECITAALSIRQGGVKDEPPWLSDIAMQIAVQMEVHAALSTTTAAKAEAICEILSAFVPPTASPAQEIADKPSAVSKYQETMTNNCCGVMYMGLLHLCDHPYLPPDIRSENCSCRSEALKAAQEGK